MSHLIAWAQRNGVATALSESYDKESGWGDMYISTRVGGVLGRALAWWRATRPPRPRIAHIKPVHGWPPKYRHVWRCTYRTQ